MQVMGTSPLTHLGNVHWSLDFCLPPLYLVWETSHFVYKNK